MCDAFAQLKEVNRIRPRRTLRIAFICRLSKEFMALELGWLLEAFIHVTNLPRSFPIKKDKNVILSDIVMIVLFGIDSYFYL